MPKKTIIEDTPEGWKKAIETFSDETFIVDSTYELELIPDGITGLKVKTCRPLYTNIKRPVGSSISSGIHPLHFTNYYRQIIKDIK